MASKIEEATIRMLWALVERHKVMNKAWVEGFIQGYVEDYMQGVEETIRKVLERGVNVPPDVLESMKQELLDRRTSKCRDILIRKGRGSYLEECCPRRPLLPSGRDSYCSR